MPTPTRSPLVSAGLLALALVAACSATPEVSPGTPAVASSAGAGVRTGSTGGPDPVLSPSTLGSPAPTLPVRSEVRWSRRGGDLLLDGAVTSALGMNAYQLSTWAPAGTGACGRPVEELDALLASLPAAAVVRVWAFQAMATTADGSRSWAALDRLVGAAERTGRSLALVLSNQSGTCDDGIWHDQVWYDGVLSKQEARPVGRVPYLDWVEQVTGRYARSSAVAWWEPVNEPEVSRCEDGLIGGECYGHTRCVEGAAVGLRRFIDEVGDLVDRTDPGRLLAAGVIGGGQCGLRRDDYLVALGGPHTDVLTVHDYTSGLAESLLLVSSRRGAALRLDRPLVVEEVGVRAGPDCLPADERDALLRARRDLAVAAGVAGWMPWNLGRNNDAGCTFDADANDPGFLGLVRGTDQLVVASTEGSSS